MTRPATVLATQHSGAVAAERRQAAACGGFAAGALRAGDVSIPSCSRSAGAVQQAPALSTNCARRATTAADRHLQPAGRSAANPPLLINRTDR